MQDLSAPYVTAAIGVLLALMIAGWGWETTGGLLRSVSIEHTQAKMNDGTCVFTADFVLRDLRSRFAFARHQQEIRDALVGLMRTKSRYMVETPAARQGLAVQMRNLANYTVDRRIADAVSLPEFDIF
jgi:hypothetical protein